MSIVCKHFLVHFQSNPRDLIKKCLTRFYCFTSLSGWCIANISLHEGRSSSGWTDQPSLQYSSIFDSKRPFGKEACIQLRSLQHMPNSFSLCSIPRWGAQSKAFLKSMYITSTPEFLSEARVQCSEALRRFVRQDVPCRKPCGLLLISLVMCSIT